MKTTKRILAILLTFAMMATVLCLPAFAVENSEPVADQTGEGVEAVADEGTDVIEIATAEQFLAIADNLEGNYKLVADIHVPLEFDLDGDGTPEPVKEDDDGDGSLEPVHFGTFKGTLDGGNHTLTIEGEYDAAVLNAKGAVAVGSYGMLFNGLNNATIKNLQVGTKDAPVKFVAVAATGGSNIGVLGSNAATGNTLNNVHVYLDANLNDFGGKNLNIGAFFGKNSTGSGNINMTNCTANGKIYGAGLSSTKYFGGFIGSWTAGALTLENCTNNLDVELTGTIKGVGGFVGIFNKDVGSLNVTNCVNNGNITDGGPCGAVVGTLTNGEVTLTNVLNFGTITGSVTGAYSMVGTETVEATMTGCVNLGTVNGESGLASAVTQTNEGAGVRIHNTADESGLRFKFTMDEASLDALEALTAVYGVANVQVGAIFLPTELVGEKALTAENYANALTMAGSASEITDGYYHASLVKLYDTHYNTEYSCQSFWRYRTSADGEWITVYANNTLSRTVAGVAAEALANGTYNVEQTAILTAYANAQNG